MKGSKERPEGPFKGLGKGLCASTLKIKKGKGLVKEEEGIAFLKREDRRRKKKN